MKKFFFKFALYLLPFFLYAFAATVILSLSGELMPLKHMIKAHNDVMRNVLVGTAYSNRIKALKLAAILERKPEIIVLGPSIVLQFRKEFFKNPDTFYNAGHMADLPQHFNIVLDHIPASSQPKIIILGPSHLYFNPHHDTYRGPDEQNYFRTAKLIDIWFQGQRKVFRDLVNNNADLKTLFTTARGGNKIGLNAVVNNNGYRNDGSYLYGKLIADPKSSNDYYFGDTSGRIDRGDRMFEWSKDVSQPAADEIEMFLSQCKKRGIYVIGFLPPFPHAMYHKMQRLGEKYEYIFKLEETLRPLFEARGYSLYNFSDLAELGGNDRETLDGFHCSEKAYLRLFIRLVENELLLKEYADIEYLKGKLKATNNPYLVFPDNNAD